MKNATRIVNEKQVIFDNDGKNDNLRIRTDR